MKNVEPLIDTMDLLSDRDALQVRAAEQGYLYFSRLLPEQDVLDVRQAVLQRAEQHGLLKAGTDLDMATRKDGLYMDFECREPTPDVRGFFNAVHGLRVLNAFFHHPQVIEILEMLMGEPIFVHPRVICHMLFPGRHDRTAEPHQDFAPVKGTERAWTVWIPLGDCRIELGGVAVAPGSHRNGLRDRRALEIGETLEDQTWGWSRYQCGDVLMFSSLTVHQGRDNRTADEIRLSTSARYQPISEPVDSLALLPQRRWADWGELYADWDEDDPLKYYWERLGLNIRKS